VEQFVKLVGIARLAAEGSLLKEKRQVEYRSLPTRNWLNRCISGRVPFHWTINPYRGCEYGCKYCYARFTHEFMERSDPTAFEKEIYAKDWNRDQFRTELTKIKAGQVIGLGTATDPYQPAERIFERTREVLKALLGISGISLFVTTKSNLPARDADLLKELSKNNEVRVTFSVTTMDSALARQIEPMAPRPDLRLKALAELHLAGVLTGVIASPVLPFITDSRSNLEQVARAARDSGADQFGANVLFLKPSAKRVFFPFVKEVFPQHLSRYKASYSSRAFLTEEYSDRIRETIAAIRRQVQIGERDLQRTNPPVPAGAQLLLF
jgi:DNA repair photolyase